MTDNHSGFTTSAGEQCIVEGCTVDADGNHSVNDVPRIPMVQDKHRELTALNAESKARVAAGTPLDFTPKTAGASEEAPPSPPSPAEAPAPKRKRRTKAEIEAAKALPPAIAEAVASAEAEVSALLPAGLVVQFDTARLEPVNPEPVQIKAARERIANDDEDVSPVELAAEAVVGDATAEDSGAADLLGVIRGGLQEREREPMGNIGPSMLGGCERKYGYQLAFGSDGVRDDDAWIATIGTATHGWLDRVLRRQVMNNGGRRWYASTWIEVPVRGVIDVYDAERREVVDFKVVGATTLGKARKGEVDRKYDVQLDVYAVGMMAKGFQVERVAALFLPKTQGLGKAVWYSRPVDVGNAVKAVARLREVETIVGIGMPHGEEGLRLALAELTPTEDFCSSCPALKAGYCKGVVSIDTTPTGWGAWDDVLAGLAASA